MGEILERLARLDQLYVQTEAGAALRVAVIEAGLVEEEAAEIERLYRQAVVDELESREVYRNLSPKGEPMLGRRGLYRQIGGDDAGRERELALLWILNLSDGETDLATIVERSGLPGERLREATEALVEAGLLARLDGAQR